MTLADRLNQIIGELGISKAEFARKIGITENYIYVLTGNSRSKSGMNKKISPTLARLISSEFGYNANWLLTGEGEIKD